MRIRSRVERGLTNEQRFMRHVIPTRPGSGCWLWTSARNKSDTKFRLFGKMMLGHQAAWILFIQNGDRNWWQPQGHEFHHTCFNHFCVNPDHLVILSKKDHRAAHKKRKP